MADDPNSLKKASITVVIDEPPTVNLSASPFVVPNLGASTLTWSSNYAESCVASGGWSDARPLSGSEPTGSLASDRTYVLTCSGPGGTVSKSATVIVNPAKKSIFDTPRQLGEHCDKEGNPIRAGNGNKYQIETDYVGTGPAPLEFKRYYNSRSSEESGTLGAMWRHSYDRRITQPNTTTAIVTREDGKDYTFTLQGSVWKSDADITDRLVQITGGWSYSTGGDSTETYNASGVLVSVATRTGLVTQLAYTNGVLTSVTDPFGRALTFTYANGRIDTLTDPAGGVYRYGYSPDIYGLGTTNLTSVTYPDANSRTYQYGARVGQDGFPNALTAIIDENGQTFAQWLYDASGRATASWHGANVDRVTLSYNDVAGTTTITDANSTQRTYHFTTVFGVTKPTQIDGTACASCGGSAKNTTYDANGFVASRSDHNGNVTKFVNNIRGLIESQTEAFGTAEQRTVNTVWHINFRVPVCREEPMRTTLMDYDASGLLTQRIEVDTTDTADFPNAASKSCTSVQANRASQLPSWNTRSTGYSYYTSVLLKGLLQSVNGPMTPDANGIDDITTYVYDSTTGTLSEIQRPYAQTTRITAYDAHGRPTTLVDPNGLTTKLSYTARGWLDKVEVGSDATGYELTDYGYDKVGNLTSLKLPSGDTLTYSYDTAHRLTDIRGANGEHIHYTLDALGNRTETSTRDVTGALKRKHAQVFNLANRLESIKNALGAVVQSFTYDANGNALTHTDANANTTTTTYDALDRVKTVLDAAGGLTRYGYDTGGHLAAVTDPKAAASTAPYATTYLYDGLDNLKTQTSPDTKITSYSYDPAGHVKTKTDARGITASYRYDALGRLTQVTYPSEAPTTYTYDSCTNGKGRLCQITDPSGRTQWSYDLHGRVLSKTQASGSLTLVTRSSYDSTGQLKTVTTPSGHTVTYSYAQGKVTALNSNRGAIMSTMAYDPFGPLKSWTFGNGQAMQRNYNSDGQLDTYTRGSASIDMNYNLTGTVKEQLDLSNSANTQSYGYDALNRLTTYIPSPASGGGPGWGWSYDPNGNRESAVQGGTTKDYQIDPASNLLKGIDAITYSYDAVGNTLNDGSHSYQYDERNRLSQIDAGTANELRYVMNALGQRVAKLGTQSPQPGDANSDGRITRDDVYTLNNQLLQRNTAGGNPDCNQDSTINTKDTLCINTKSQSNITNPSSAKTYYAYDEAGHLIGEYDANGNAIQETIWFLDQPVATIKGKNLYFIHSDHLNTPRAISDKNKKIVWTWNSEPFGNTLANEDADNDGEKFVYNLRFPGQVYDQENGLHYNYFRTYNPTTGRYTQSDPIGLRGGLGTYSYGNNDPLWFTDPLGLMGYTPLPAPYGTDDGPGTLPGQAVAGAIGDLMRGRRDMMDAATKRSDAYFHCRANCEASKRGLSGYQAAVIGSAIREIIQNESPADRASDEAANIQGQCAGKGDPNADCYKACSNLIPASGIPRRHLPSNADPIHIYQLPK